MTSPTNDAEGELFRRFLQLFLTLYSYESPKPSSRSTIDCCKHTILECLRAFEIFESSIPSNHWKQMVTEPLQCEPAAKNNTKSTNPKYQPLTPQIKALCNWQEQVAWCFHHLSNTHFRNNPLVPNQFYPANCVVSVEPSWHVQHHNQQIMNKSKVSSNK